MKNSTSLLLSVIVPIYNIEDYLPKCIESILNQDIESMEVILVDDGSTDGSGDICDKYAASDKRIIVIHKTNGGVNTARNAGLDISRGEYITMVDGDDRIKPNTFKSVLSFIDVNPNVDLVQYPEFFVNGDSEKLINRYPDKQLILTDRREMIASLIDELSILPGAIWGKFYKRMIWKGLRLREDMQYCEDMYILPFILEHCHAIAWIPDNGYCYVSRNGSATQSASTPKKKLDCLRFNYTILLAALKYQINTGYWWNETCFAAIDAYSHGEGPSKELDDVLAFLQQTKHRAGSAATPKKLAKTARIFPPRTVARINRARVVLKKKLKSLI